MTTESEHDHRPKDPSGWVQRFLEGVKSGGSVLDVACGAGRHMRLALDMGFTVTGIDRDLSNVEDLANRQDVGLIEADLETGRAFPLKDMRYDGVIVTNYLYRPILSDIVGCVATDGVLIYETAAAGNERYAGPSNPDYLLKPNELIDAVMPHLVVVAYENGLRDNRSPKVVGRIAACGSAHPWANDNPVEL
ncbi:MAG: class I SAM-dependent methyltransferase [Hyphomicrobiaceae bacterium]|nr:class I SAM-dependent methyltransferase [Hyphomicrobiaceae bacterium]